MSSESNSTHNNSFGELLKGWILKGYKNIRAFERVSDIPYPSLQNYIRGNRNPSVEVLFKLQSMGFDAFNAAGRQDFLEESKRQISKEKKLEAADAFAEELASIDDLFRFVRLLDVRASAGQGTVVHSEDEEDQYAFNKRWLRMKGLTNVELSVIHVSGDSMEPILGDSDVILIRHNCELVHGKIFVINHGGEIFVKRTKLTKAGWLMCSDNPKYDPILMDESTAKIGMVVASMRDI